MNWRGISYPLATLAASEAVTTASVHAWRHATWSLPDPLSVAWIYIIMGVAALIYGAIIGDSAASAAEERADIENNLRIEKEKRERADREKYMEKFGVAPDPDVIAGESKRKKRESVT